MGKMIFDDFDEDEDDVNTSSISNKNKEQGIDLIITKYGDTFDKIKENVIAIINNNKSKEISQFASALDHHLDCINRTHILGDTACAIMALGRANILTGEQKMQLLDIISKALKEIEMEREKSKI
jgi:hypothetical protein